MDFSFMTVTFIDVGVLSISMLGLWMLKRRGDRLDRALKTSESRYDSLQEAYTLFEKKHEALQQEHEALQQKHEALQQEHETLQQRHEALQQELKAFQSTADRRYNTLQTESERQYKELQAENNALHEVSAKQVVVIEELKEGLYELRGRYNELSEKLLPMLNQVVELLSQKQ